MAGTAATLLATHAVAAARGRKARLPNFLVLLTDDQRWNAMGCMGNPIIQTPNMDRLAAEGIVFDNHFCTTSICMSSRASIFTGMYARTHRIVDFSLPLPETRLSQSYPLMLRAAGYRTGFVGKWGLGGDLPTDRFDFFEGFSGQGKYFQERDGEPIHLTSIMGDNAIAFLKGCTADQPFCLSVSFKAPHVQDGDPRQYLYDPKLEDLYKDVTFPPPENASPEFFERQPEFVRNSEGRRRWETRFPNEAKYQESVKGYYRLVTGVDIALGRILDALRKLGLDDNTVILFTSDNGLFLGARGLAGKWLMYEESIRLPLIIRDPRLREPLRGTRCDEMTLTVDLAPTVLHLANVERPMGMQGRSLTPLLRGKKPSWRTEWFYEHEYGHGGKIPRSEGIRTKTWKYIRYVDRDPAVEELYDLEHDPHESNNLTGQTDYLPRLEEMRQRWHIWRGRFNAFDPDGNRRWTDPEADCGCTKGGAHP